MKLLGNIALVGIADISSQGKGADVQSKCAWRLLDRMLTEIGEENRSFCRGEFGKPYLVNGGAAFSLSHSGDRVMCALSLAPIGCDVQQLRRPAQNVLRRAFTPREQAYIQADKLQSDARFSLLWAAKESYIKLQGGTAFSLGHTPPQTVIRGKDIYIENRKIHAFLSDGYAYAVCSECEITIIEYAQTILMEE